MTVAEQTDLFSQPSVALGSSPRRGTPAEQWQRAVDANPWLPDVFADTARQLLAQGIRASANRVAEEIRDRHRTVGDQYAFNNTWRTPAADWLRLAHPDLARDMQQRGHR